MLKIEQFGLCFCFGFIHVFLKILSDRYTPSTSFEMHALHCLFAALHPFLIGNHIPAAIAVAASNAFYHVTATQTHGFPIDICLSVPLSVRLSNACIVTKRDNCQ